MNMDFDKTLLEALNNLEDVDGEIEDIPND